MSEDVKQRILEGAMGLFMANGIKKITMDEIAESLSMSKRTIYENFKDKNTLVIEGVKYMDNLIEKRNREIERDSDNIIIATMKSLNGALSDLKKVNPKFFKEIKTMEVPKEYFMQKRLERQIRQEMNMQRGQEEGYIRTDLSASIVSDFVVEGMKASIMESFKENPDVPLYKVTDTFIKIFVRGISTEKGQKVLDEFIKNNRTN